jgi:hypothetical protein
MEPQKLVSADDDEPRISIDDLIKANIMQKLFAEATIRVLEQAKADQEELNIYRQR